MKKRYRRKYRPLNQAGFCKMLFISKTGYPLHKPRKRRCNNS